MRLSNLLYLYRIRLRARLVQELLALVGIAAGVALLYAASVANTSLTESVERLTAGIVGNARFQVQARSADGFDGRLLERVERLSGVRAAAPMLDLQANVVGPGGRASVLLVGGDPRFARLGGAFVRVFRSDALARQQVIGLPASLGRSLGLSIGGTAAVEIAGRRRLAPVGALFDGLDVGDLAASPVAIAPLAYAQRLAGLPGRLTRIYVVPEPGRAATVEAGLRELAGDRLNVRPARFDVRLFDQAALPTHASTTLFFAFSAGVGFLFAFSAMLLTVPQRRRLLGDLSADGFGPRVVLQVLVLDAVVLGVVASAVGLGIGELVSRALFSPTPGYLGYTFPIGSQRIVTAHSVLIAAGGGLLAALAAVVAPYGRVRWRQGRSRSMDRGDRPVVAVLVAGAALALAATTVVLVVAPQLAILGMASLTLAGLLLLPLAVSGLLALLDRATYRWRDAAPFIALVQLRSREQRFRSSAIMATGLVALLSCVAIQGARADLQRGLDAAVRDIDSTADVWVTAAGASNTFATTALASNPSGRLARLPGVEAVRSYRGSFLDWGDRRVWVLAPPRGVTDPVPASQIGDRADRARASERVRAGGWAVLARQLAEDHGIRVGDRFTLPSPVPLELRVAAVSTNLGWPPGAVVLNADNYARGWHSTAASAYQLIVAPGASVARVSAAARAALGSSFAVETANEREQRHYASTRDALGRLSQIRTLVLVAAVLAMAAALVGLIWQRRPRLARLKLDGFSDAELRRAFVVEALVLVGGGALLGALLGLYGQVLLDRALSTITGFPVFVSVGVLGALAGAVLVTAAAVLIVSVPGTVAARVAASAPPAD